MDNKTYQAGCRLHESIRSSTGTRKAGAASSNCVTLRDLQAEKLPS